MTLCRNVKSHKLKNVFFTTGENEYFLPTNLRIDSTIRKSV